MATLLTVRDPLRHEIDRIKGSRFIAHVARARSEHEAREYLSRLRAEMPDATHHVSAWRIDRETVACDDDGEPRGTSGRPLLDRLVGRDLQQVVVVVTRYFGGTKLGKGGLVRAYGQAASEALDRVALVEQVEKTILRCRCAYDLAGPLEGVAIQHGAQIVDTLYEADVTLIIEAPVERCDALARALTDRAAGRLTLGVGSDG